MENDELLHKWVNNELSEEEMKAFKARPEYGELHQLYQQLELLKPPAIDEKAMLDRILAQPKDKVKPGRRRLLSTWVPYGIAASLLFLLAWAFWPWNPSLTTYQLAKGERFEGQLPDQSSFVLNAESKLSFDQESWSENREVQLKGEAFFDVAKGSTFTVKTDNGSVQVLGTRFNVQVRGKVLEVSCQEGRVAVSGRNGKLIDELTPGKALRLDGNKGLKTWNNPAMDQASWVNGLSRFEDVPIYRILDELERQYDIKIDRGSINLHDPISTTFQHNNLDLALQTILGPININFTIEDNRKVILTQ